MLEQLGSRDEEYIGEQEKYFRHFNTFNDVWINNNEGWGGLISSPLSDTIVDKKNRNWNP